MCLKSVYMSQYKNVTDFDLNYGGSSIIIVFVCKNGSGKSKQLECLTEVFGLSIGGNNAHI